MVRKMLLLAMLLLACGNGGGHTCPEVWVNCEGIASDFRVCSNCKLIGGGQIENCDTGKKWAPSVPSGCALEHR